LDTLSQPVVYKSPHFCNTGWGVRDLSLKEFVCSFGLASPSHVAVDCQAVVLPLFPLKLLEAPLQHVLYTLSAPAKVPVDSLVDVVPLMDSTDSAPSGKTWLPTIGKFVPSSWLDETVISDKASKSDDAQVPAHLWDNHITLVLPQIHKEALAGFRSLALLWQRRYMYCQFRAYLRDKFGPAWLLRLLTVRRQAHAMALAALFIAPPPPRGVRQGRGGFTPSISSALSPALPARLELLLHLDGDAGCQVMNRYFGGEWWDWQSGSSLAFWR
jgi:hypothetical protein